MWRCVYIRVLTTASEHACDEYLTGLAKAGYRPDRIPDVRELDERLYSQTGWRVAPVTGSLSAEHFFEHLTKFEMPCTMYIRPHTKYGFTQDPDCIHEMLGHIPALFIPSWSRLYHRFGTKADELTARGDREAMDKLILMYFAIVEKGMTSDGNGGPAKAIGASLISGTGELLYAMDSPEIHVPLDMDQVLCKGSTDEEGYMPYFFVGKCVDSMAEEVMEWMEKL